MTDPQDTSPEAVEAARYDPDLPAHDLQPVEVSLAYSDYQKISQEWDTYINNKESQLDSGNIPPADTEKWESYVNDLTAMIEHGEESGQLTAEQVTEIRTKRDKMRQRIESDLKTMPQNSRVSAPDNDENSEEEHS